MRACLVLLMGLCACAGETSDEAASTDEAPILSGVVEPSYPAVGMLKFASGNFGTGTLITPSWVLTAAHVALGNPKDFYYGVPGAGKQPVPDALRRASVDRIVVNPCYTSTVSPCTKEPIDVALVHLTTPITDVSPIPVVDVPLESFWGLLSPFEGQSCAAVGFGMYLENGRASSGVRRSAKSFVDHVGSTELETVRDTGIATSGDSGGPLICNGHIIGTVRGSAGAVPKDQPYDRTKEGYERTDLRRAWIRETTR